MLFLKNCIFGSICTGLKIIYAFAWATNTCVNLPEGILFEIDEDLGEHFKLLADLMEEVQEQSVRRKLRKYLGPGFLGSPLTPTPQHLWCILQATG